MKPAPAPDSHGRVMRGTDRPSRARAKPSGFPRKIGLLGGSFNPAHDGHRSISLFAMEALGLDEVWWLVSPGNPLKPAKGMAPLAARYARASDIARRSRIRPTTIESQMGTRYTYDTLRALMRQYPRHRFIWLMGADNLRQFGQWKNARGIARSMPMAVIARPGYDDRVHGAPVLGWFRHYTRPAGGSKNWTGWRVPALVRLRFHPDARSATALRSAAPLWHYDYMRAGMKDAVTRRMILPATYTPS